MNKKVKGAVIFTSGLIGGVVIGGGLVINKILDDDDFRGVVCKKVSNKVMELLYGEKTVSKYEETVSKYEEKTGYKVEDVYFPIRKTAEDVLEKMKKLIDRYGLVSVQDYYDLSEVKVSQFESTKFGWVSLKNADVEYISKSGYIIDLPQPIRLN